VNPGQQTDRNQITHIRSRHQDVKQTGPEGRPHAVRKGDRLKRHALQQQQHQAVTKNSQQKRQAQHQSVHHHVHQDLSWREPIGKQRKKMRSRHREADADQETDTGIHGQQKLTHGFERCHELLSHRLQA